MQSWMFILALVIIFVLYNTMWQSFKEALQEVRNERVYKSNKH
jgi:archaellum component FlaF (FlaF/FlaG flagellin family)